MYKLTEMALSELKRDAYRSLLSTVERLNDNDNVSVEDIAAASQAWEEFIGFCKPIEAPEAPEGDDELTQRTLTAMAAIEKMNSEILEGICHEAITRAVQFERILTTKDAVTEGEHETLEELIDYVWKTYGVYQRDVKKAKYINRIIDVDYAIAPKVARALDSITDAYDDGDDDPDEMNERARENCPYDFGDY